MIYDVVVYECTGTSMHSSRLTTFTMVKIDCLIYDRIPIYLQYDSFPN